MKRAFTLIEMMIVVALIATLMTIVLRLSSVSSKETKRNTTVVRLARLENCLSGYYAAYGNYPPVRLHNSRDIYQKADGHGVQSLEQENTGIWGWKKIGDTAESEAWNQVKAACEAQPVGAEFPFADTDDNRADVQSLSAALRENASSGKFKNYPKSGTSQYRVLTSDFDSLGGANPNLGRFSNRGTATSWREIQVFKFGLMSFLLPRYQMMMAGKSELYDFAQWTKNNRNVSNPMTGDTYTWKELQRLNEQVNTQTANGTVSSSERAKLENIVSDAVCVRWLPNLANICATTKRNVSYYGVEISDDSSSTADLFSPSDDPDSACPEVHIYSPDGDSTSKQYILDAVTVQDGWGTEFFYYSPSPHQSYQIWSAGENLRTFPPWVSRQQLSSEANECIYRWTNDDIKGMRN